MMEFDDPILKSIRKAIEAAEHGDAPDTAFCIYASMLMDGYVIIKVDGLKELSRVAQEVIQGI